MIIKHTGLKIWISENIYSNLPNNHVRPGTYSCRQCRWQVFSEINKRVGDKIFQKLIRFGGSE